MDPFSRVVRPMPFWVASRSEETAAASALYEIDLCTDPRFGDAWQALAANDRKLHDGMIIGLWVQFMAERAALSEWRPRWITEAEDAQLMAFPQVVTNAIAALGTSELSSVARSWSEAPYLSEAGSNAEPIARTALVIMKALAIECVAQNAELFAECSGYADP